MSEDTDTFFEIDVEGELQSATLADFAGIDMSQIEARRGAPRAPEGVAEWRVAETDLSVMAINDKDNPGEKRNCPVFTIKVECLGYRTLKDPSISPEEVVGMTHAERFFIKSLREDMGRIVAFMEDIGMQNMQGSLPDLGMQMVGAEFVAPMKHRKDRNDPDRVFANLDMMHVEPLQGAPVPGAAAPAAAPQPAGLRIGAR